VRIFIKTERGVNPDRDHADAELVIAELENLQKNIDVGVDMLLDVDHTARAAVMKMVDGEFKIWLSVWRRIERDAWDRRHGDLKPQPSHERATIVPEMPEVV
jgi:hypothetical protein